MGQPRPFFRLFSVFSNKLYTFYSKSMWKMSKCPSSVWQCMDSNPQPYKHESSPITTRPGLPPKKFTVGQTERAKFCKIDTLPNTLSSQVKWVWIIESDFWKVIFASNVVFETIAIFETFFEADFEDVNDSSVKFGEKLWENLENSA